MRRKGNTLLLCRHLLYTVMYKVCMYLLTVCSGDALALKVSGRETCRPPRWWLVFQEETCPEILTPGQLLGKKCYSSNMASVT